MPDSIRFRYHFIPSEAAAAAGPACLLKNISAPNATQAGGGDSEPIRAVTPSGEPIGYRHGQVPHYQITFNVAVVDDQEVDWLRLEENKRDGWKFALRKEAPGGSYSINYTDGIVQTCEEDVDEAGNTVWAVTCTFLYKRVLR